jgi:hypothetical protein
VRSFNETLHFMRIAMDIWPTEFLEKREVQLIIEAAAFPDGTPQNKHLMRLSRKLQDAILRMEGVNAANPWANPTHPDGIEMFKGAV